MKTMSAIAVCIGVVALMAASLCGATELTTAEREFLDKPIRERREWIAKYPPDQQVELYLKTMLMKHPPDLALADSVAASGASLVPVLLRRLATERRDIAKMYLVDVFCRMEGLGHYSARGDANAMKAIEEAVRSMQDAQWKQRAEDFVERLKATNGKRAC